MIDWNKIYYVDELKLYIYISSFNELYDIFNFLWNSICKKNLEDLIKCKYVVSYM